MNNLSSEHVGMWLYNDKESVFSMLKKFRALGAYMGQEKENYNGVTRKIEVFAVGLQTLIHR